MTFHLYRLRFHLRARRTLFFPAGQVANRLRGALGKTLKGLSCNPSCQDAKSCADRSTCSYARLFEPCALPDHPGPSGLQDLPRPFVLRPRALENCRLHPGQSAPLDIHLFDTRLDTVQHMIVAVANLAANLLTDDMADTRWGALVLERVTVLDSHGSSLAAIFEQGQLVAPPGPLALSLAPSLDHVNALRLRFLSPTEIKAEGSTNSTPSFQALFSRVRDRLSTLRNLYADGPLSVDFRAMGERAGRVTLVHAGLGERSVYRRSFRTGQTHSLGGFVGELEYAGDMGEFVPWLEAGQFTGVGRQTVWGKGEYTVESSNATASVATCL